MADYIGAGKQLDRALELDPTAAYVLQEAARNAFFAYDFPRAGALLERVKQLPPRAIRDETIFADLMTQLHYREADYLALRGDFDGAARALGALLGSVVGTELKLFDTKHLDHLRKDI